MEVLEKIKYKEIPNDMRTSYVNRLVRFGYPPDVRQRIYFQILNSFSIQPNISKKIFEKMKPAQIDFWVAQIWNKNMVGSYSNNQFLDEIRCFSSKKMLEDILNVSLPEDFCFERLQHVFDYAGYNLTSSSSYDEAYLFLRRQYPLILPEKNNFQIKKIILTEGETEAILLPKFAKILGCDFELERMFLVASGGKNQVVKDYLKYKDILNLPIITILDNDAKAQYDSISSILRPQDKILLLEEGEFEDLIPRDLICKVLSWNFKNMAVFSKEDFASEEAMSHILYEIFRTKGLGDFKKVEFAKMIFEYIKDNENLGEKIAKLVVFLR